MIRKEETINKTGESTKLLLYTAAYAVLCQLHHADTLFSFRSNHNNVGIISGVTQNSIHSLRPADTLKNGAIV